MVDDVPAVPARNLSDQSEAEPGALGPASAGNTVKRREQPLACFFHDHRSMVEHVEHDPILLLHDGHFDGWLAMEFRIFRSEERRVGKECRYQLGTDL